jgi:hypothetical protein
MLQYYNVFGILDEFPKGRAYIGNGSVRTFTSITASELINEELGRVAWKIRQELQRQRSREQTEGM